MCACVYVYIFESDNECQVLGARTVRQCASVENVHFFVLYHIYTYRYIGRYLHDSKKHIFRRTDSTIYV